MWFLLLFFVSRYINTLEADGKFAYNISVSMLRKPGELIDIVAPQKNRTSNCRLLTETQVKALGQQNSMS